MSEFAEARRESAALTSGVEKRALLWLAARLPARVTPDHLTALGLVAMALGGLLYAGSARRPWLLLLVNVALALNWFGDSLDGTLARYRQKLRPRYGFYVDHLVDTIGALLLLGGLALSGHVSLGLAAALLISYYLLSIDIYLATYTLGRFKISYGRMGGTEARILLGLANVALRLWPEIAVFGHRFPLFDLLAGAGTVGLLATFLYSVTVNTRELWRRESTLAK